MKKLIFVLTAALVLTGALLSAILVCGCSPDDMGGGPAGSAPAGSAMPSASPSASPTASAAAPSAAAPSASASASASQGANASAEATQKTGSIEGFMEGGIVDPEDVPEITEIFAKGEDYAGMAIQSITYKLNEGRQAYYVILQGLNMDDRAYYVYADGSVEQAEAPVIEMP